MTTRDQHKRIARCTGLCLAGLALASSPAASAQMNDNPQFNVFGIVIVWAADENGNAPIASDFIIDTGTGNTAVGSGDIDLIAGDVHTVTTGTLSPMSVGGFPFRLQNTSRGGFTTDSQPDGVTDARDSFDAFSITGASNLNTRRAEIFSSFYAASNTGFAIDAQAIPIGATTPDAINRMRLQLRVTLTGDDGLAFGSAAQFPHSGGAAGGSRANNRRLSTLATPRQVFAGNQRTARIRGSISQQSVRFDARYRLNLGNYDLSFGVIDAAAEVTYTVYVP